MRDGTVNAFWTQQTCERPAEGSFDTLALLADGRFVSIWYDPEHRREIAIRALDGTWSTLAPVDVNREVKLINQLGRVAVLFDGTLTPAHDFGVLLPDERRGSVRTLPAAPSVAWWALGGSWAPRAPVPPFTFSDAHGLVGPPYEATPTYFQPGAEPVRMPELTFPTRACGTPKNFTSKFEGDWAAASSWVGVPVDGRVLYARLEQSGTCVSEYERPAPFQCPPGAPCAPPAPPELVFTHDEQKLELVISSLTPTPREAARITLPARGKNPLLTSLTFATDGARLTAWANGRLIALNANAW
ncbi:MAG: hypothetical protein ACO1OB_09540 [Archangium sp.]